MSDEMIMQVIETIGAKAETALYVYWFLDFASLWIFLGLCTWGIRTAWKTWKKHDLNV